MTTTQGCLICLTFLFMHAQPLRPQDTCRVLFYNVENLYDPFDDSLVQDEEFLPDADRAWTYGKFRKKLVNISRAIIAAGNWNPPALIGLCEIENHFVLKQLLLHSPLKNLNYEILHAEGPDPRGVDVALLYRQDKISILYHRSIRMTNPEDTLFRTRDVLYAKVLVFGTDTLHLMVNHWPSKYGGIASSLEKRKFVAGKVRHVVDSVLLQQPGACMLLMGDYNDGPDQEVMTAILKAGRPRDRIHEPGLTNLMFDAEGMPGTHKYQGEWSLLDQFVVSTALFLGEGCLVACKAAIVKEPFLLEDDNTHSGSKPFRTFAGPRYLGGFSDHLPVVVDIVVRGCGGVSQK